MKKFILLTVIALLFTAVGSVSSFDSVSVAANTEDAEGEYTEERKEESHGRSEHRYWAKESFTVRNRKGVIKDSAVGSDDLYATIITLKIPPKENSNSSKDIAGSDSPDTANSADQG